ncbi:MAG: hypothetical protein J0H80_01135, partial [Rhizobiales bacterium]|nr:hypothetical protein [Hyphomicrobiales bacterium]
AQEKKEAEEKPLPADKEEEPTTVDGGGLHLNIVGKIDLDKLNQKTRPDKKKKPETAEENGDLFPDFARLEPGVPDGGIDPGIDAQEDVPLAAAGSFGLLAVVFHDRIPCDGTARSLPGSG